MGAYSFGIEGPYWNGIPMFPGGGLPMTQGKFIHVKPYSGSDDNNGKSARKAVKTLSKALSLATANQNDVVLLYAENNTAGSTTDYQSSTLTWNKDMVHLIGVGAPSPMSNRARIAFLSTYSTASNLFTLSANACIIANVAMFAGVSDTNPTGCLKVTGSRNVLYNCHIAGIGHDNNDIAGAYSLYLYGVEEMLVQNCRIGLNTISAGTNANSEILMSNTVKNVFFKDCTIYRRIEHASNHPLVKIAAATSLDEFVMFRNCAFISTSVNYATSNAAVFKFVATPTQGLIFVVDSVAYNGTTAGKWDADDSDKIVILNNVASADTDGLGRLV